MTKTEFQTALRGVINQEFVNIPAEGDIICQFSASFEKRMGKLIRKERTPYRQWLNTSAKRVAVLVIVLFSLTAGLASVDAIREPVIHFFTEVFEDHIDIVPQGESAGKITYEYRITELPEGYIQTDINRNDYSISTTYTNKDGNILTLRQSASASGMSLDNEHGKITEVTINDMQVLVYESNRYIMAIWYFNGYRFILDCSGYFEKNCFLHIISTIQ